MALVLSCAAWTALASVGCGDGNGGQDACPAGFETRGAACVPIFDDCTGPAEIPVLGGGCQAVGVTVCATGLCEADGEGGCEPILPPGPEPCPPGTMELLGETACQPVGVDACGAGFASDGEGGCDAILPPGPEPCPPGTMELLGSTACQALGSCGTGTWGDIVDDGVTVYVDQTADATGANGTAQAPFVTIGEALAVAPSGGRIAVAAGEYTERLTINQPLRLAGRCAALVTIRGRWWMGDGHPPVAVGAAATGTEIRGVTLTGPAEGLVIMGAQQVVVEQVEVRDASDMGIFVQAGAEVRLRRVVVAGCTTAGVVSDRSTLLLEESVVRDTRSRPVTDTFGRGINVECTTGTDCGSLQVASCLVTGNRDVGIQTSGVDAEVTGSVVRDTLPRLSSLQLGIGINAQCTRAEGCGSLRVSSSLVSGNREIGINTNGMDLEVTDTVVRDTLPQQSTGLGGRGIWAQGHPVTGASGRLRVSSSLVVGNREEGLAASGMDTEVIGTVVRDTLPLEATGDVGRGISARCSTAGVCGSLQVSSCLVSGNHHTGIFAVGVDTEVTDTVVRDTLPEQSTESAGRGISARCSAEIGACGGLRVSSSLVSGNRDVGIYAGGVDTEITSTVVRDTLPHQGTELFGEGIGAQCHEDTGSCGSLQVSASLVSGNREVGILLFGVDAEITGTVVRDTLPQQPTGQFGRGINAQCDLRAGSCGRLLVTASTVVSNENVGIFIAGVPSTLEGVAVLDTQPNGQGAWQGIYSQGIWALCEETAGVCATLQMSRCLVETSYNAGLALEGVSGFIASSAVRSVAPQPSDGKYGYGVQVGGLEGAEMPTFHVNDCEIRNARLGGILYYRARGTLSGSVVSGGENSVLMNEGSELTIRDNNDLAGTVSDEPTWSSLIPSPAPPPALPSEASD